MSFPRPHDFDLSPPALETAGLAPGFRVYLVAVAFIAAGYADFALIAYHFGKTAVMPAAWIPIAYAMAVDGAAGLALGSLFDPDRVAGDDPRDGDLGSRRTPGYPRRFCGGGVGMVCWGIGTGAQESVMRATIAQLAPRDRRATAFGIFNAVYGIAWFAGSVLLGILYDRSIAGVVIAPTGLQAAALPVL